MRSFSFFLSRLAACFSVNVQQLMIEGSTTWSKLIPFYIKVRRTLTPADPSIPAK